MTDAKRNEIIVKEIERLSHWLSENPRYCGTGFHTDIFKLKNGKPVQIEVLITTDEIDFDEDIPTAFTNVQEEL